MDLVQDSPEGVGLPGAPPGADRRPPEPRPQVGRGHGDQALQQGGPGGVGDPGVDGHRVDELPQLPPLEGPAGEVPAAPPAGLVVHRQPVALEGGQVPVEALPLGHDALLLQPGGQSGQGQGAGLVGLVVQDAGQGQGPVPLVSVMLPHHLSLLHRRPIGAVSLCFQGHYRTVVRKKQGGIRTGVRKWGLGEAVVPGSPCQGELSAKLTEGWGRCGMHDCFDRASCGVSTLSSFAA